MYTKYKSYLNGARRTPVTSK